MQLAHISTGTTTETALSAISNLKDFNRKIIPHFRPKKCIVKRDHLNVYIAFSSAQLATVIYNLQKNYTAAVELFNRGLAIYRKKGACPHETAYILLQWGQVEFLENHLEAAENCFNEALKIFEEYFSVAQYSCLEALADLYLKKQNTLKNFDAPFSELFQEKTINYLKQAQQIVSTYFNANSNPRLRIREKLSKLTASN